MRSYWNTIALRRLPAQHLLSGPGGRFGIATLALICIAMMLGLGTVSQAQVVSAQFNGTVYDPAGKMVVDASVTLQDMKTNLTRTVKTDGQGFYEFPLLQPGTYRLSVSATGFQAATSPVMQLDVNQTTTQDFHLHVGSTSQTVSVSATAPLLQASSTELGTVIGQRTVSDLPLNGRNFTALLIFAPGVSAVNYDQTNSTGIGYATSPGLPSGSFIYPSIQGQWNREDIYYVDGISDTQVNRSSYNVPPIIDDIQEFKVQSHNDGAQYGDVMGGVVNIVSKSGTNAYHGAAWEYVRNNDFDARNPFTDFINNAPAAVAPYHQNEFGADVGGPLRIPKVYNGRDKTFLFFAWESWRYSNAAETSYISPTAAELDGNFTNASVVTSTGQPALIYNPFDTSGTAGNYSRPEIGAGVEPADEVGHVIPASMINAEDQSFLKTYSDTPNFTPVEPGGPNTILNAVGSNNAGNYSGRIDQSFGPNDSLYFHYGYFSEAVTTPVTFHIRSFATEGMQMYGGGYTHVFSPSLVMDVEAGRSGEFTTGSGETPLLGVPASGFPGMEPTYGSTSFSYEASSVVGQTGAATTYNSIGDAAPTSLGGVATDSNFGGDITWIRGNHQMRFGFQEIIMEQASATLKDQVGSASFVMATTETADPQNEASTGNSIASALVGVPDSGRFGLPSTSADRYIVPDVYGQDTWKVRPNLTLILGLRWDGQSSPHLLHGTNADMFDPVTGNWIISGTKLPPPCDPAVNVYAPCIPNVAAGDATASEAAILAAHVTLAPNPNLGPNPDYKDFAPRVGIDYKLGSSYAIRAGYGIVYDTTQGSEQTISDRINSWPSNYVVDPDFNVVGGTVYTMADAISALGAGINALPAVPTPFTTFGWYWNPAMRTAYSQQYNLDIEKQLTSNLLVSVSYVGSVNRRLQLSGLDNNSPVPGEAGADRQFPWEGTAIEAESRGTSNFNAGEIRVDKRMSDGLAFGSGYTWSKSLDNGASGFYDAENGTGGYSAVQNYNDLSADYGVSAYNITNTFYTWGLYALPFGSGQRYLQKGVASYILGNWTGNVDMSAHSGPPLGFADAGIDPANIGNTSAYNYCRASVTGSPKLSHPTKLEYFNTSVFYNPVNEYGNTGRGMLNGPKYDDVDFALEKQFPIHESVSMQFRAEFFNLFNIQNYGTPGTTFGSTGFGEITSLALGAQPRQMQFSLRTSF